MFTLFSSIMTLGNSIRKVRELRNVTQEYMAIELEISQVTYSRIEAGKTKIDIERLIKIAKLLEVDIMRLIHYKNNEPLLLKDICFSVNATKRSTMQLDFVLSKITAMEKELLELKRHCVR